MGFWVWMGVLGGAVLGALGGSFIGAAVGALIGAGLGVLIGRAAASSRSSTPQGADDVTSPPPRPAYGTPAAERDSPADSAYRDPVAKADATHALSSLPERLPAAPLRTVARASADPMSLIVERLESIDRRLASIEARLGLPVAPAVSSDAASIASRTEAANVPLPASEAAPSAAALDVARAHAVATSVDPSHDDAALVRASDGTLEMPSRPAEPESVASEASPQSREDAIAPPGEAALLPPLPRRPAYGGGAAPPVTPREPSALWRWMTGGNAMTRVGIVILFFGVAFLLRYFAEIVTVPIELKLAGAGAGGVALAAIGFLLARRRPAYGLSLQGAGMGIVYLTVFAAFRLYEVLAPAPAIALLVLVSGVTIAFALRHDSQPLAALALAGGFLAPVLIRTGAGNAALLFGYFAVLNAVVFALAWKRAWRPLNVLGFVFTFALALLWGWRFYTPAHYAIVQPYLALFFAFYLTIAILYARRGPLSAKAPVDGVLVFGVPIVGFALQMAIVRGHRYGVAWSAGLLAALYGVLWFSFRRSAAEGLALLSKSFAALAVMFATLAVPFAVDPRSTSAWWALEAAAVYWLGVMQRQTLMRGFALALQVVAAVVFLSDYAPGEGRLLMNANFLGMVLIGLAGFASAWAADRHPDHVGDNERALVPALVLWGIGWWIVGGVEDLRRNVAAPARIDAALGWVMASSALALVVARALQWPRIAWVAATLFPAMVAAGWADVAAVRTTLTHYGWVVWPLAWLVLWSTLRFAELARATTPANQPTRDDMLRVAHAASAIALVAWTSWELSEWVGRHSPVGSIWLACAAALPMIAFLFASVKLRDQQRWPFRNDAHAYGATAGTTVAAFLFAWLVIVSITSRGDPAPLPYLPLLNPLDLTLIAAIAALAAWDRAWGRHAPRTRYAWLGATAFLVLNGAVVRTAHHWGDVAWRFDSLLSYRPLQAALTLTWTVTALAVMLYATRSGIRVLWTVGAVLLAAVVIKLFAVDLAALSGLTRVIAFMGVGLLLLVIGYVAPLPPAIAEGEDAGRATG
jgi:uncharacterized membrane protein